MSSVRISVRLPQFGPMFDPAQTDALATAGMGNILGNFNATMQMDQLIPVDEGALAANIQATIEARPDGGSIGSTLDYAPVMEDGREPGHFPPVEALMPWVKRKLRPSPEAITRKDKAFLKSLSASLRAAKKIKDKDDREEEVGSIKDIQKSARKAMKVSAADRAVRSVAWAVAIKINQEGIAVPLTFDGRGAMFARALDATRDSFPRWFLEAFSGVEGVVAP